MGGAAAVIVGRTSPHGYEWRAGQQPGFMTPRRYEIHQPGGAFVSVRAQSPINAVAGLSRAPRHSWERDGDWLLVTARAGDGRVLAAYRVLG